MRLITAAVLAVALATLAGGAVAAPSPITLTFNGAHVQDSTLPAGVNHKGRFTASPPLCAAGSAADTRDVELEPLTVLRTHVCDDGSGSFTALLPTARNEHGGVGSWQIVEGTGRYATLRGVGTYTGHFLSGDPTIFETIVYRTEWQGVVDFDAVAPTIDVTATTKKLPRPARTYAVKTTLDAHEAPIAYSIDIRAGSSYLAYKAGSSTSGRATANLRIRAPRGVRSVNVIVTAADVVGNQSSTTKAIRLK